MDASALRREFPVLSDLVYLNAGTDGPLAQRAADAARDELERELLEGRGPAYFERRTHLLAGVRRGYATALGCPDSDVALTTCTSEGLALVVDGLELGPGQEILTSEEEHPGLLGTLQATRDLRGVSVRTVPFVDLADGVSAATALVACSHVNWLSGEIAPAALAEVDVPVLLDGAQGLGAVPVDLDALGCDAYAAAGQKWLCGPDGSGALFVSPHLRERLRITRRGYANLSDPGSGLHAHLHDDARRLDTMALSAEALACARGALDVLEQAGWSEVYARARDLADALAQRLREADRDVARRGPTTLVSFASPDPDAERDRLAEAGIVLRSLPGRPWLRASVGAWNDEDDLEALLAALKH